MCLKTFEIIEVDCQATHWYAKANNKYMNNYDKDIKSSYIAFLDANNLHGWAISQKLPVNGFKCVEKKDYQILMKTSWKNMMKIVIQDTFLK